MQNHADFLRAPLKEFTSFDPPYQTSRLSNFYEGHEPNVNLLDGGFKSHNFISLFLQKQFALLVWCIDIHLLVYECTPSSGVGVYTCPKRVCASGVFAHFA